MIKILQTHRREEDHFHRYLHYTVSTPWQYVFQKTAVSVRVEVQIDFRQNASRPSVAVNLPALAHEERKTDCAA